MKIIKEFKSITWPSFKKVKKEFVIVLIGMVVISTILNCITFLSNQFLTLLSSFL